MFDTSNNMVISGVANKYRYGELVTPYDGIPGIVAAYSTRLLLSSYIGPLIRLRRSNDNAESDFGFLPNGDLNTPAISAWLGGNSGYVVTWYDQSGGARNATQATAAAQPLYVASGQNGKPVARFDGVANRMVLSAGVFTNFSIAAVLKVTNTVNGRTLLQGTGVIMYTGSGLRAVDNALNPSVIWAGVTAGTWHVLSFVNAASVSKNAWSNGASGGAGGSTGTGWAPVNLGYDATVMSRFFLGDMSEIVLSSAAWSDAQRQAAEAAANSYWAVY